MKTIVIAIQVSALIASGAAHAQGMLLDAAADKVIMKYQTATCDELRAQKKQTATDQEKQAIAAARI